ncbi:MAG: hypothetical protein WD689_08970 [Gaiellaceae bacterium]
MSATRVEIEEIESTKSEKFLAVVLAAFLLVGGIWFYAKSDDWIRDAVGTPQPTAAEQSAFDALDAAHRRHDRAIDQTIDAQSDLELAREAYRTALDAGRPAVALEREYVQAQERFRAAERDEVATRTAVTEVQPAADRAGRAYGERQEQAQDRRAWIAAIARFLFIGLWLALAFRLLGALRRRDSRYLPIGFAVIGAGTLLALLFASDYVTDYLDPLDLGPLLLSLVGAALTLVAFVALQRYLAQRIPLRRVRKAECPFCGFPVRGDGAFCEGCGREVVAACATCGRPRRVGTARCAACGAA